MNPFNIERFKTIFVNTEHLNIDNKSEFIGKVLDTMRDKFENVNVFISSQRPINTVNAKEVFIHNSENIDEAIGKNISDLGSSNYSSGQAEVNVNDVVNQLGDVDTDHLADAVGTIASHESGHLLLPREHSGEGGINLMTEGETITPYLQSSNNNLEFTDTQIEAMNWGIENPESEFLYQDFSLADYENYTNSFTDPSQTPFESWQPDESIWGNLDVDGFDKYDSLPDIEGVDYLQDFDIGSLDQIELDGLSDAADGFSDTIGDLFDILGDILDGIGGIF